MRSPFHTHILFAVRSVIALVNTIRTADIPQLVADLDGLDSGFRGVQPCIAALLARVALVNANVIAIPASTAVRIPLTKHKLMPALSARICTKSSAC